MGNPQICMWCKVSCWNFATSLPWTVEFVQRGFLWFFCILTVLNVGSFKFLQYSHGFFCICTILWWFLLHLYSLNMVSFAHLFAHQFCICTVLTWSPLHLYSFIMVSFEFVQSYHGLLCMCTVSTFFFCICTVLIRVLLHVYSFIMVSFVFVQF